MTTCTRDYGYCIINLGYAPKGNYDGYLVAFYEKDKTGCTEILDRDRRVSRDTLSFVPMWGFKGLGISNGYLGEAVTMVLGYATSHAKCPGGYGKLRFFDLDDRPINIDLTDEQQVIDWLRSIALPLKDCDKLPWHCWCRRNSTNEDNYRRPFTTRIYDQRPTFCKMAGGK